MTWVSAVLTFSAKGGDPGLAQYAAQGLIPNPQNKNNVYAVCTISDDSTPPNTMQVATWANALSQDNIGSWLGNVVAAANNSDAAAAALKAVVGQPITIVAPSAPQSQPSLSTQFPTVNPVINTAALLNAYQSLITAGVIDNTDPGYLQAQSDATVATAAQSSAVTDAVASNSLAAPSQALKATLNTAALAKA